MDENCDCAEYQDFFLALNRGAIISECDMQGDIVFVNDNFCSVSGYSREQLLGKNHRIVNSGKHPRGFFVTMWQTILDGRVWQGEICNRKKNGDLYWVRAIIFPIFDAQTNQLIKFASVRFEITAEKAKEHMLQRMAENYKAVIEVTDGFCHITSSGRILEVSDGFCQLTGYERTELLDMAFLDLYRDFSINLEQFNLLTQHYGKSFDIEQKRRDHSVWFAEVTVSYSSAKDRSLFIFLRNVTEQKKLAKNHEELRQQLLHMQKLESIGRLTAGIAHDFNNILASIMGYNEISKMIIENEPLSTLKTDLVTNFDQVAIAVSRAVELIDKMLTYTRQNTLKAPSSIKSTPLVIEEVLQMARSGLTSKFVIDVKIDETTPTIEINAIDLHQVLTNLLVNARDAMVKGTIKIRLRVVQHIDIHCNACLKKIRGNFIELSVSDTGSGIDNDILPNIFDPFFTTKEVGKGTGLGLSVISGIIHNANGHIVVKSTLNVGTTFRLLFPIPADNIS